MKCACGKSEAGMGLHGEVSCWGNGHDTTHHTAPGCLECAAEREAGLRAEVDKAQSYLAIETGTSRALYRALLAAEADRDAWRARAEKAEGAVKERDALHHQWQRDCPCDCEACGDLCLAWADLAALPPAPEEPWLTCGDSACGWTGHQSELDNGAHCPWCGLMVDRVPAPEEKA